MSRIRLVRQTATGKGFDFGKVKLFEDAIAKYHPTLVIIDNVSTFSQRATDSDNQVQVVRELEPIADLARKYDCAIVVVHHHNKKGGIMGSVGYQTMVRNVVTMEEAGAQRMLHHVKSNLGKKSAPLLFEITEVQLALGLDVPRMIYVGKGEPADAGRKMTKQQRCNDWLTEVLSGGPVAMEEIVRRSKEQGFNSEELKRAKSKLAALTSTRDGIEYLGSVLDMVSLAGDNK